MEQPAQYDPPMTLTRAARAEGGLLGLLVGDALGVPYEFRDAHELPPIAALEMDPPPGFSRAHPTVPPGTWSDDGAQALCLLASLLERGSFDAVDFAGKMVGWYRRGYMAVDGRVFDVGITTRDALEAIVAGAPPLEGARSDEHSNGNGGLMRVLPLALWHVGSDAELVRDAHLQTRVTHGHVRAQVCSALYCLWARRELSGTPDAWCEATATLRELYQSEPAFKGELEAHVRPDEPASGQGSGYVVDCLHSARMVCGTRPTSALSGEYERVVRAAIALGDDTDTTASVAGGIAGIRGGVRAIPARWLAALRGGELLAPVLRGLAARARE